MKATLTISLTLLICTIFVFPLHSQNELNQTTKQGAWELGINAGAAWQKGDIKAMPGWGVGLTLGKNIYHRPGGILDLDLRGRLLYTQTYGEDHRRSTALGMNPVFNGISGEALNYNADPGYLFQNHRSEIGELSLEAVLTANRLREKTGVILSVFGGIGADLYQTKADQLNPLGDAYNYTLIDSLGGRGKVLRELDAMRDGEYETRADGFRDGSKISIMPSWGLGVGYQVTPSFSVGVEHKITYALNDVLEGQRWASNTQVTESNDKYHYTNLYLRWKIFPAKKNQGEPITEGPGYIDPILPRPNVQITRPGINPFNTDQPRTSINASLQHVQGSNDIVYQVNGQRIYEFSFNSRTGKFVSTLDLVQGYNEVVIEGANSVGRARDQVSIIYQRSYIPIEPGAPGPRLNPPNVNIIDPNQDPYYTSSAIGNVEAIITNVSSRSSISLTINGRQNTDFTYDTSTDRFRICPVWEAGSNKVVISAVNLDGSDTDAVTVIYQGTTQKPQVSITQPYNNPFYTGNSKTEIKANITGVNSRNEVRFTVNGYDQTNFSFNTSTNRFTALVDLRNGNNTVKITASNQGGSDSDSRTIVLQTPDPKPSVSITKPSVNPHNTSNSTEQILASILGISLKDQITFRVNSVKTTAFSFNASNGSFSANVNLREGENHINISATNNSGSDSDSRTINYSVPLSKPTVKITEPSADPFYTNSRPARIVAKITGVTQKNNVSYTVNGQNNLEFSFNSQTGIFTTNANLISGNNTIIVNASNTSGQASDRVVVIYREPVLPPTVIITDPVRDPSVSKVKDVTIKANLTNVENKEQILFKLNGKGIKDFRYTGANGMFGADVSLVPGKNEIIISASNEGGNASDRRTINYEIVEVLPVGPDVTITRPAGRNEVSTTATYKVQATISGLTGQPNEKVTFLVNGQSENNFTFSHVNGIFVGTADLNSGANIVVVKAENRGGSDQDSRTIIYNCAKPTISITLPETNPYAATGSPLAFEAIVGGVSGMNNITVLLNGRSHVFSYDHGKMLVATNMNLVQGNNTIRITAENDCGQNSKSLTVNYFMASPSIRPQADNVGNTGPPPSRNDPNPGASSTSPLGNPTPEPPTETPEPIGRKTTGKKNSAELPATKKTSTSEKPVIELKGPATNSSTKIIKSNNAELRALVHNVAGNRNIRILVNGSPFNDFSYNMATKELEASIPIKPGSPVKIEIIAVNGKGTVKSSMNLQRK